VGEIGEWPGQINRVAGLALGPGGDIYVADVGHRVVQRFTDSGHVAAIFSSVEDEANESV
jgi:sorbitol-specific phosphotransferase system component IIA